MKNCMFKEIFSFAWTLQTLILIKVWKVQANENFEIAIEKPTIRGISPLTPACYDLNEWTAQRHTPDFQCKNNPCCPHVLIHSVTHILSFFFPVYSSCCFPCVPAANRHTTWTTGTVSLPCQVSPVWSCNVLITNQIIGQIELLTWRCCNVRRPA